MMELIIKRTQIANNYILGELLLKDGSRYQEVGKTLELGFKNNEKNISSIPTGTYEGFWRTAGKKFQFVDVPDRTAIQIHIGNYTNQIEGCILLGATADKTVNPPTLVNSANTVEKLYILMGFPSQDDIFKVTVKNSFSIFNPVTLLLGYLGYKAVKKMM